MKRSPSDAFGFRGLSQRKLNVPDHIGNAAVAAANTAVGIDDQTPEYVESINLETLTDALCKAVQVVAMPNFGTTEFDVRCSILPITTSSIN